MWLLFSLACMVAWGAADLFYKKSAEQSDSYSHLKTSVIVGAVMGLHAIATLIFGGIEYDFINILIYFPVSLMYILSMTIGYFGLRYLALSVSSPVQNTSGAIVCLLCLFILGQRMDTLTTIGVIIIIAGVIALGLFENKKEEIARSDRKYRLSINAIFIPVIYCIIDALGTFLDAYYLDDIANTPLAGVNESNIEDVANISYELTFLAAAVIIFIFLKIKKADMKPAMQGKRLLAAVFETAGQYCYVYAMSGNAIVAAPMVAAYSIISLLLSRIFLKEKLSKAEYATVAAVMCGIILLGVAEALTEA